MGNVGPEQETPELPGNKEAETKVEGGDHQTSSENRVDEQNSQLPVEADLTRSPEHVEISREDKLAENSDKTDDTPLEKEKQTDDTPLEKEKQTDDTPLEKEKQTDDTPLEKEKQTNDQVIVQKSQMGIGSNQIGALDAKTGDENEVVATPLENKTESVEIDDTPLEKQTNDQVVPMTQMETGSDQIGTLHVKAGEEDEAVATPLENKTGSVEMDVKECHLEDNHTKTPLKEEKTRGEYSTPMEGSNQSFTFEPYLDGDDSGTEEEQAAFMKDLENFYWERSMDFKPPKFYGEALNCLKLWRAVTRLGGYDQVTVSKLWRQVGESFNPPKTCTTVSWSFRIFFEKALLEYEKHKIQTGELKFSIANLPGSVSVDNQLGGNQASGSGRARRDAAARAMQGWHTQRLLDSGEDKSSLSFLKRDKQLKSIGTLKKRKASNPEHAVKVAKTDPVKPQGDIMIIDAGAPADWVKINVQRTKECFEVYALVPGLLREEVQVQSDPAGRLIISGEPEQQDNPWGVTPFKKVITLPSRIDPHQTSAVVTLHGQLLVRAPLEEPDV